MAFCGGGSEVEEIQGAGPQFFLGGGLAPQSHFRPW